MIRKLSLKSRLRASATRTSAKASTTYGHGGSWSSFHQDNLVRSTSTIGTSDCLNLDVQHRCRPRCSSRCIRSQLQLGPLRLRTFCLAVEVFQKFMTRRIVERLRREVIASAVLSGAIGRAPKGLVAIWTWPQPQPIDELKAADAEATELETGTISFSEACKRKGTTSERVLMQRARDGKLFKKYGLQPPGANNRTPRDPGTYGP